MNYKNIQKYPKHNRDSKKEKIFKLKITIL